MPTTSSSSSEVSVEAIPDIVSHTDTNNNDTLTSNNDTGVEAIVRVEPSAKMDQDPAADDSPEQAGSSSNPEHVTPEVVAIPLPMVDNGGQD